MNPNNPPISKVKHAVAESKASAEHIQQSKAEQRAERRTHTQDDTNTPQPHHSPLGPIPVPDNIPKDNSVPDLNQIEKLLSAIVDTGGIDPTNVSIEDELQTWKEAR